MEENQAPATWICECSQANSQARTTCEICGLLNPAEKDHIQQQNPSQSTAQPSLQIEEEPSRQIQQEPQPQPQPQDQRQNQPAPSQEVTSFHNIYDYGPVQIVGTYPNTGDLVPKSALQKVIAQNWKNRDTPLIIISQLGIINQGKSLYANILNQKLLKDKAFTSFPVGTATKGLTMFSNPLLLEGDPNTQIMHLDVEGAFGITEEPPEIQRLALKRLYVLSMLLSSVVMIHLGPKPSQNEVSLLSEACDTVLFLKSKLYLDIPKIYLLIKEAEDDENYRASIENLRQMLKNQLKDEIFQNSEILPRGKLSDACLNSDPFDYTQVGSGYQAQMQRIINSLKDHQKKHPIEPNQLLKISDLPNLLEHLGGKGGILNNSEYLPYLERSIDYLRTQGLSQACQKHIDLYAEECKALSGNAALTEEQFTQQLTALQTKHRANFSQEVESISKKKVNESPLLQSFMKQFDIGMKISSFEKVFFENKCGNESQQAEKEKYQRKKDEIAQQQQALQQEADRLEQDMKKRAEEHKQDIEKCNAAHLQLIEKYKAEQKERIAQLQEQQRQRQQQMEAETAKANAEQQRKAQEYQNQQAQLNQRLAEEKKQREEDERRREENLQKIEEENQQKMEEEKAKDDQRLAEIEKNAKEQEDKRQEEAKIQQEQQAQEQAQMQQQIQAAQDDVPSGGGCCNIF